MPASSATFERNSELLESSSLVEIREHIPEGQAIIFEGPQRVGKTLSAVLWALDAYQHNRPVFSNIQLGFPHAPIEFSDLKLADGKSRYWGGHVFIDELNFYYDSRRSLVGDNLEFGAFLLQQKKQGCNITGTTHDLMSLDVRLRQNYDYLIRPSVFPRYPKPPEVLTMRLENGPLQPHCRKKFTMPATPFLGLYDSFAVYDPFKGKAKERTKSGKPESRVKL